MSSPHYEYSSTQINLPYLLANDIVRWGEEHISRDKLYVDPENPIFGYEDEPHVTVLYGLHSENPYEVRKILEDVEPFEIKLGKVSIFTICPRFDVIKVEAESPMLHRLNFMLRQVPNTQFYQTYKPHVTVAYLKKGECQELVGNTTFLGRCWMPRSIIFSSKLGTRTIIPLKFKPPQRQVS